MYNDRYNEAEVLQLLAQGSEAAFRKIYDRYWKSIYITANHFLHSSDLADDIVQEIFSAVWARRSGFTDVKNLKSYLVVMTRNLTIKQLKTWANEVRINQEYTNGLDKTANDTDQPALESQYDDIVQEAISMLPPQQRQVFHMAKVDGLSHDEIAQQLGISRVTVKSYMAKSLQFIRQHLSPHIGIYILLALLLQEEL